MGCVVLMWVTFKTVWVCTEKNSVSTYNMCVHLWVVGVYLATDEECVTGEVRLVGGVGNSSSGLLEVCINGGWGTACDYQNEWNSENVVVVCRQLNLQPSSQ